jgi:uncharacterized protein YfaP (DUF2135 family)
LAEVVRASKVARDIAATRRAQSYLEAPRQSVQRMINDGTRAGEIISRIRALVGSDAPRRNRLDINVIVPIGSEFERNCISLQTQLTKEAKTCWH